MFRLPRSVDYSFLILSLLADQTCSDLISAPTIAARCNLPIPHTAKILKSLQRLGIVGSIRGTKGGYYLNPEYRDTSLFDVYQMTEGTFSISECLESSQCKCSALPDCKLKPYLRDLNQTLIQAMQKITLSSLNQSPKNCHFLV